MHSIKLFGMGYILPDRWEAMTPEQIYFVLPMVFGTEPTPENRLAVLRKLIRKVDSSGKVLTGSAIKLRTIRKLSAQDRFDLFELVRWCWTTQLNFCPIESFELEGVTYYLPEPNLANAIAIEYAMADVFFRAFTRDNRVDALNKLIATLCRPQKRNLDKSDPAWDGDVRERYNAKLAEHRAELFSRLPLTEKILILQYFTNSVRHIHSTYDIWEKPAKNTGPQIAQQEDDLRPTWLMILMDLAEKNTFGTWDDACYTPLHTILFYLSHQKAKQEAA